MVSGPPLDSDYLNTIDRVCVSMKNMIRYSIVPLLSARGQDFKIKICGHVDVCFNPVVVG